MANLLLRDIKYLETYGCYPRKGIVELESSKSLAKGSISFRVLRLAFNSIKGTQILRDVQKGSWQIDFKDDRQFALSFDFQPGYYLLLASEKYQRNAIPFTISDPKIPTDVAVIRPVFTQWSYHAQGFYSNTRRSLADRMLKRFGRIGLAGQFTEQMIHKSARKFNFQGINFERGVFPAHSTVNLSGFYCRNDRWDRIMWDAEFGQVEGLWVDEVFSGMPIFAILDKNTIPYHVFTDVDLHNQNEALKAYRVLIFSGQEGMTPTYYRMLQFLQESGKTSFLLWGVQGFGYRQLDYDAATGELRYVCTRGHQGMWGDRLEERQPDWEDEATIFGFHFPEPQSAHWRQKALFSQIRVLGSDHPIAKSSKTTSKTFYYEIRDHQDERHPGLTWAGGEVQRRAKQDASVIAHLDDDRELIGIGEYRNTILFSPTYLPAFFAFQGKVHPEVEAWFMAALHYLLDRSGKCVSA